MKFFALVILPAGTDVTSGPAIEAAVSALMAPFQKGGDGVPADRARWEFHWPCTKQWMSASKFSYAADAGAEADQSHIVFPVDELTPATITGALVTPTGEWHQSTATFSQQDPGWPDRALAIARAFAGHHAALVFCHG